MTMRTVEPCVLDHVKPGTHRPGCPCATDHDDDHDGHCRGCAPALAQDRSEFCAWHDTRLRAALHAIPEHVALIEGSPDGRVARRAQHSAADRRPTKVNQGSPSPAWDEADDAVTWAWQWVETAAPTRTHAGGALTWTKAGLPARDLTRTISYLLTHLDRISHEPYAADFAFEALNLARRLELYAGQDRLTHRLPDRCPTCNHKTLVRHDGADRVECRNPDCSRIWDETAYANLAHVAAS